MGEDAILPPPLSPLEPLFMAAAPPKRAMAAAAPPKSNSCEIPKPKGSTTEREVDVVVGGETRATEVGAKADADEANIKRMVANLYILSLVS